MRKFGVLVISHGSRSPHWVDLVDEAVQAAARPDGVPICSSFLEIVEGRLIQDGIDQLESLGVTDLIVIPLFVSSGSTHIDEIQYALGVIEEPALETDLQPFRLEARVHFGVPLDEDADVIAQMLYDQIQPLSVLPEREKVLVVGHGSVEESFHQKWRQGLDQAAERLMAIGGFAGAEGAMLLPDQTVERMERLRQDDRGDAVLVAPLFLSEGYFTEQVIPKRLEGMDYRYNGRAMLPHPLVIQWMERQIAERVEGLRHS
jgi:sirohydrochlorin ferrochelatase